ncbi:hypothetical protein JF535_00735 [Microbulbifer salipaludis]|uniref:DUF3261 domain-containing protein n=1 Tax=Microbulbifer salipaludis TaxID=187980 RepID=A0ABS3E247_9GAMM|nr:hypothetical protein [Microbulbifer salipaludis]MBN8429363.1 hypothetical protein [Microbulbifer salipaludis]
MDKKFILIMVGMFLSSCAVLHEEYFYPRASGATVEKKWCRGKVGVDNQLIFSLSNVDVTLEVWEYNGVTRLGVSFNVSQGGAVVWPSQTVIAFTDSRQKEIKVNSFTRLRRVSGTDDLLKKDFPVNSVMNNSSLDEAETYYESFEIPEKIIEEVKISEIRLLINGIENVLSDLTFTKKTGLFLHPLNC